MDPTTLMRQAPLTTNEYLLAGIQCIDSAFGDGYAREHPELLGAFVQASAMDFAASHLGARLDAAAALIADMLDE